MVNILLVGPFCERGLVKHIVPALHSSVERLSHVGGHAEPQVSCTFPPEHSSACYELPHTKGLTCEPNIFPSKCPISAYIHGHILLLSHLGCAIVLPCGYDRSFSVISLPRYGSVQSHLQVEGKKEITLLKVGCHE